MIFSCWFWKDRLFLSILMHFFTFKQKHDGGGVSTVFRLASNLDMNFVKFTPFPSSFIIIVYRSVLWK